MGTSPQPTVRFQWALPLSELDSQRDGLAAAGAQELATRDPEENELPDEFAHAGFEPITILIGLTLATKLAEMVVNFVKDARRPGVIVDTRGATVVVTPEPSLDRGFALIVDAEGTRLVDARRSDDAVSLITAATKLKA